MLDKFNKKNLHLAELKYFDMQHNGIEVTNDASFAIVYGREGYFCNALDQIQELPTFERVHGTTNSYGDEYFGTKVRQLTDECSEGPCWLLSDRSIQDRFPGDIVTLRELEDFVLDSPLFFRERMDIAKERLLSFEQPFRMARIIRADKPKEKAVDEFFTTRFNDRKREYIKR